MNRPVHVYLAAFAVFVMVAAACTATTEPVTMVPPSTSSTPESRGMLAFGQTHHSQIDKTVRKATPFEIVTGPYAAPRGGAPAWAVELTFTNNTDEVFAPIMFQIDATVDGHPAEEVLDTGYDGVDAAPSIAPGETATIPVAFLGQGQHHTVTIASLDRTRSVTITD